MRLDVSSHASLRDAVDAQKVEIDKAAGSARARHITSVQGQAETYMRKSDNAKAYLAAGSPADLTNYPWVAADAEAYGLTAEQAATSIVEQEKAWQSFGAGIEKIRLGYKVQLDQAVTTAQVNRIARTAIQLLDAI